MNQTGLLPCLNWSGSRWWLPLSSSTANSLAQILLCRSNGRLGTKVVHASLFCLLRTDPAFYAWAVCELTGSVPELSLNDLANRIISKLQPAFASADRVFNAPSDLMPYREAWSQLSGSFDSRQLAAWLEVTGSEVPVEWSALWPRVAFEHDLPSKQFDYGMNQLDLCQLANELQRSHELTQAFSKILANEKLAAMKELAYGLSHEINNPLANISTRAQALMRDEESPDRKRFLDAIVGQSMRAYEMIADMMYFANPPQPYLEEVSVSVIVEMVASEFAAQWRELGITYTSHLQDDCTVALDQNQFADSVRSLVRNATESISLNGQITIRLRKRGSNIELRIYDNGAGLSARDRQHAFDPYYSGREAGRGLGLGLCKVKRVAELHGGDVSLRSGPVGTMALLWLPVRN